MAIERVQAGAQSATFFAAAGETLTAFGPEQWASLPEGKLKALLNRQYVTSMGTPDGAGFARAWADAAATHTYFVFEVDTPSEGFWRLSGGSGDPVGFPVFIPNTFGPYGASLRVQTSYSASE